MVAEPSISPIEYEETTHGKYDIGAPICSRYGAKLGLIIEKDAHARKIFTKKGTSHECFCLLDLIILLQLDCLLHPCSGSSSSSLRAWGRRRVVSFFVMFEDYLSTEEQTRRATLCIGSAIMLPYYVTGDIGVIGDEDSVDLQIVHSCFVL